MKPTLFIPKSVARRLVAMMCFALVFCAAAAAQDKKSGPAENKGPSKSAVPQRAEKLTTSSGAEYYGWQLTAESFMTCTKQQLPIAGGKITKTSKTCTEEGPITALVPDEFRVEAGSVTGRVDKFDVGANTFTLKIPDGEEFEFFLPQSADSKFKSVLKGVKPGDTLVVREVTKGRAEEISKDSSAKTS